MLVETERDELYTRAGKEMPAYTLPYLTQIHGVVDAQKGEFRQFAIDLRFNPNHCIDPGPGTREARDRAEIFEPAERVQGLPPGHRVRGAFGLSVSPVWRIGPPGVSAKEWTPERSRLVGVVTGWNDRLKILVATSASKILEISRSEAPTGH